MHDSPNLILPNLSPALPRTRAGVMSLVSVWAFCLARRKIADRHIHKLPPALLAVAAGLRTLDFRVPRSGYSGPLKRDLFDIPQMTCKFGRSVPPFHRQGNCIPSAAVRWPDFGYRPALGSPSGFTGTMTNRTAYRSTLGSRLRPCSLYPYRIISGDMP